MKHFVELLRHLTRPRLLALAAVLIAFVVCCLPVSAQTYSVTEYYPPHQHYVGYLTGPFGLANFGNVYTTVPPRAVTRTYQAPPPQRVTVIQERPVVEYVIEAAPQPEPPIERQRITSTPRRTVVRTYYRDSRDCPNPNCNCPNCRCGPNCACGY